MLHSSSSSEIPGCLVRKEGISHLDSDVAVHDSGQNWHNYRCESSLMQRSATHPISARHRAAKKFWVQLDFVLVLLMAIHARAALRFVDLHSTNSTPPYINWSTAATNIQDA